MLVHFLYRILSVKSLSPLTVTDVHKVGEFQNSVAGTRNAEMLVDHVGDLSSSEKSVVVWGFLLFQMDVLLEVRVRPRSFVKAVAIWASSVSHLGKCFPAVESGFLEVVDTVPTKISLD